VTEPLASVLNFLPAQVVANTTIIPVTSGYGQNLTLKNNTNGSVDLIVDVVGHFSYYQGNDCAIEAQYQYLGAHAAGDVVAVCAQAIAPWAAAARRTRPARSPGSNANPPPEMQVIIAARGTPRIHSSRLRPKRCAAVLAAGEKEPKK